jgi:hypothetical protein
MHTAIKQASAHKECRKKVVMVDAFLTNHKKIHRDARLAIAGLEPLIVKHLDGPSQIG